MAHVRTYNPSVRVGNWNEDIQLEEDTLKDFLDRRANGKLLYQETNSMIGRICAPMELSTSSDGTVCFGNTVMLFNKGNPDRTIYWMDHFPRDDNVLSILPSDPKAEKLTDGPGPVCVTGGKKVEPNFRTVFKIMPADDYAKIGDKLRYGQPFCLVTAAPGTGELYLYSDQILFNRAAPKSRNQVVHLVTEKSFKTSWQIEHKNPLLRLEYENEPVLANSPCIIKHCKTFQNLSVEEDHFTSTMFGSEYEITANTKIDSHKAEKDVNVWHLLMKGAGDENFPLANNDTGSARLQ